jgi:hypothetical protein
MDIIKDLAAEVLIRTLSDSLGEAISNALREQNPFESIVELDSAIDVDRKILRDLKSMMAPRHAVDEVTARIRGAEALIKRLEEEVVSSIL